MESERIEQRLRSMLGKITGIEPTGIDQNLPLLRGGLELDSLSVASLVAAVEDEFGINITEEDLTLASLESLSALVNFVESRAMDHF